MSGMRETLRINIPIVREVWFIQAFTELLTSTSEWSSWRVFLAARDCNHHVITRWDEEGQQILSRMRWSAVQVWVAQVLGWTDSLHSATTRVKHTRVNLLIMMTMISLPLMRPHHDQNHHHHYPRDHHNPPFLWMERRSCCLFSIL